MTVTYDFTNEYGEDEFGSFKADTECPIQLLTLLKKHVGEKTFAAIWDFHIANF